MGRNVRRARSAGRVSGAELARRCGWGRSKQSKLERGDAPITVDDLLRMALELGVAPAWLLSPTEDDALAVPTRMGGLIDSDKPGGDPVEVAMTLPFAAEWIIGDSPLLLYSPMGVSGYFDFAPKYGMERRAQLDNDLRSDGWEDVELPDGVTVPGHPEVVKIVKRAFREGVIRPTGAAEQTEEGGDQ